SSASANAPPDGPLRRHGAASSLQGREGCGFQNAAFLVLVRAELAALLQIGLERWIGHQSSAPFLALGLARVLPDVHYLVELPDLGRRVEHRLAAVLHLCRMTVLLVELEPGRELVVVQRVDAQIENHACSPVVSIALVASSARRARFIWHPSTESAASSARHRARCR